MTEPTMTPATAYERGQNDAKDGRAPREGLREYLKGYGDEKGLVLNESWVYEEREGCAKTAENPYGDEVGACGGDEPSAVGHKIAKAIRARKEG